MNYLCLHTLRADCNVNLFQHQRNLVFASTRSVQIATRFKRQTIANESLCLHTLRADCNEIPSYSDVFGEDFASTRSVQIATPRLTRAGSGTGPLPPHAPCRLQQGRQLAGAACQTLPPHAPCRLQPRLHSTATKSRPLPPHAPCRLQRGCHPRAARPGGFASTRSVQIATRSSVSSIHWQQSFASTRSVQIATRRTMPGGAAIFLCLHTLRADCNGRNAQNAICTFQNVC